MTGIRRRAGEPHRTGCACSAAAHHVRPAGSAGGDVPRLGADGNSGVAGHGPRSAGLASDAAHRARDAAQATPGRAADLVRATAGSRSEKRPLVVADRGPRRARQRSQMTGVGRHAGPAVRTCATLSGEAHHPRAARGSVRLVTRFGADWSAGRAGDRSRSTYVPRRGAGAAGRTGHAAAVVTHFLLPAAGPVHLRLLRVHARRDLGPRTGRLPHVTEVRWRARAARRAGRTVRPTVGRPPPGAAFASSSPASPYVR
jgi:hypothetical protein